MPSLAGVLGRARAGAGASSRLRSLRELLVIDSLATQCLDACPHLEGAGHEGLPASSYGWQGHGMCMCMVGECGWGRGDDGGSVCDDTQL